MRIRRSLGAAGAVLAVIGAAGVAEIAVPATANASEPCPLNSAACALVDKAITVTCNNTQGICGGQVCVVLEKEDGSTEDFCIDYL
jgi:3-oxoacyl-(acyl-carrier-protein) synthase